MKELNGKTQSALRQIPKELQKLNKIIAVVGEILAGQKVNKLEQSKREFKEFMEEKERERKDVT